MTLQIIEPTTLISERLTLRVYQEQDEDILFANYFGDIKVSKYLQRLPHKDIAQTHKSLLLWSKEKWRNSDP